jgi:carboxymethylenebutenolidase
MLSEGKRDVPASGEDISHPVNQGKKRSCEVTSSKVELTSKDGGKFGAYLALPEKGNGGAVVVLQEIFGINANIRGVVDGFAEKGFIAIAPDLFWRQEAGIELDPENEVDRGRAYALMNGLNLPQAVEDALVTAEYARSLPGAKGKVGAVGYCLGGRLAYLTAMQPGVDVAVSYYGVAIQASLENMGKVRAPLLLHIAVEDQLCPPEAQQAVASAAASHADRIKILNYPGVGHAFARLNSPMRNDAAANRADAATAELLLRELAASDGL